MYTKEEYESGDGMLTTIWGPSLWHYLHTMSFNYPNKPTKEDKKNYRKFIIQMKYVLPCGHCRKNLIKNFKEVPLTKECLKNRYTFSNYIYRLHEHINSMLGKKSNLTYDQVRERYEHFRSRCTKKIIIKRENGCTESLYGEKSKCIIRIVPNKKKCKTFHMDNTCKKKRLRKTTKIIQNRNR
mgnify:CR=1 FL=1|jgi:hypothetical protein|tara:strand:+ start:322 stop:870 length:549 start_codon:yes stop_codon:yes gene_type:complete